MQGSDHSPRHSVHGKDASRIARVLGPLGSPLSACRLKKRSQALAFKSQCDACQKTPVQTKERTRVLPWILALLPEPSAPQERCLLCAEKDRGPAV